MEDQVLELVSFLKDDKSVVRKGAVDAVLGLSASDEGRALLNGTKVVDGLKRLLGDRADIAESAVSALVNLSVEPALLEAILSSKIVAGLMDGLRDPDCTYKRGILMLLTNISQTPEGCDQLMQKGAAGGALVGLHFRRLVQMFVTSGKQPAPGASSFGGFTVGNNAASDELEYSGSIVHNVTQLPEARAILLEPERGIFAALMPQLQARNPLRRRAAAGILRNCCAHTDAASVEYLLSQTVDVVTHLLLPLAGPDRYAAGEKEGMHPTLYAQGHRKEREGDSHTRRLLVEALALLAVTRAGREHLRRARSYPVVKTFHEWLEGHEPALMAAAAAGEDVHASGVGGGGFVGGRPDAKDAKDGGAGDPEDDDDDLTDPDDVACVDAINRLVQQLFREDEVRHTSEVTGRNKPQEEQPQQEGEAATTRDDDLGPLPHAQADSLIARAKAAAATEQEAAVRKRMFRYATVPLDEAKQKAEGVTRGGEGLTEEELGAVTGAMPDWTEDDPDLQGTVFDAAAAAAAPAPATDSLHGQATTAVPDPAQASTFSAVEDAGLGGVD